MKSYNDTTIVCARPTRVHNPQTRAQMMQRTKKQNIVNVYGQMKPALKDNFQGKVGKQSDYTMFVSCNLSQQPVYLTEKETLLGQTQVVAPYVVAYGKMLPIGYHLDDEWLVSDINATGLQLDGSTMVSQFADSIIANNDDWKAGDILEFICCRQLTKADPYGTGTVPHAECDYANIDLNKKDRSSLSKALDRIELRINEEGYLCMRATGEGGFAMVHKRNTVKGVATGPQSMVVRNQLLENYSSDEHCEAAIKSYTKKKKK